MPGCWSGAATEAGWIGLDPTNAMLAGNDHVVLAIGRDYADVAPIDGVIFASGGQRLEVSVQVVPVEPVRGRGPRRRPADLFPLVRERLRNRHA